MLLMAGAWALLPVASRLLRHSGPPRLRQETGRIAHVFHYFPDLIWMDISLLDQYPVRKPIRFAFYLLVQLGRDRFLKLRDGDQAHF